MATGHDMRTRQEEAIARHEKACAALNQTLNSGKIVRFADLVAHRAAQRNY